METGPAPVPEGEEPGTIFPAEAVEPEVSAAQGDLYAGQYDDCGPAPPMPTDQSNPELAKAHVDELNGMSDDDKRAKLASMSDAEVQAMVNSLPADQMSQLAGLAESANTPAAKYVMWKAGVGTDKILEFYQRAAGLSTPDQIDRLEKELTERK